MRKLIYDYYQVSVPEDLGTLMERCEVAITEARERTRLYAIPCDWTVRIGPGDMLIVRRRRNRNG